MKPPKGELPAGSERSSRGVKPPAKYSDFVVFPTPKRQPRSVSVPPVDQNTTPLKSGNPKKADATTKGTKGVSPASPQKNPRSRYDKFQSSKGTNQSSKGTNQTPKGTTQSSKGTNQPQKEIKAPPNAKHPKAAVAVSSNIRNNGRASLPSTLQPEKNKKTAENGSTAEGPKKYECKKCGFVAERPSEITIHFNRVHLCMDVGPRKSLPSNSTGLNVQHVSSDRNVQKMVKIEDTAPGSVSSGSNSDHVEGPKKSKCKKCGFVAERPSEITRHYNRVHLGMDVGRPKSLPGNATGRHLQHVSTDRNVQKMVKIKDTAPGSISSGSKSDHVEGRVVPVSADLRNRSRPRSPSKKQTGLEKPPEAGKTTLAQAPAPAAVRKRGRTSESAHTPSRDSEREEEEGGDEKEALPPGQKRTDGLPQSKSSKRCSLPDCSQLCLPSLGVSVHRFPLPGHPMRKRWLTLTNMACNNGTLYICSRHFKEDDYIYNEKLDPSNRFYRLLKGSAIPTNHVPAGSKVINRIKAELAESGLDKSVPRNERKLISPSRDSKTSDKERKTKRERSTSPQRPRKSTCTEITRVPKTSREESSKKGAISKERSSPSAHGSDRNASEKKNGDREHVEGLSKDSTTKERLTTPTPHERRSTICSDKTKVQVEGTEESKQVTTSPLTTVPTESCSASSHLGDELSNRPGEVGQETKAVTRKSEESVGKPEPSKVMSETTPKEMNGLDCSTESKSEKPKQTTKKPSLESNLKGSNAKPTQESRTRRSSTKEVDVKSTQQNDTSHTRFKSQKVKNGVDSCKKEAKQQPKTANHPQKTAKPKKMKPKKRKSVQSLENGHVIAEKADEHPAEIVQEDAFDGVERQVEFISIDFNRRIMLELQIQSRLKELQRQHEENMIQDSKNEDESITLSSSMDSINNMHSVEIAIDNVNGITEHCGSQKMAKQKKHKKENVIENSLKAKKKKVKRELDEEFEDSELKKAENDKVIKLENGNDEQVETTVKVRRSLRERNVRQKVIEKDDDSVGSDIDDKSDDVEKLDAASVIADYEENESIKQEETNGAVYVEENCVQPMLDEVPDCEGEAPSGERREDVVEDEGEGQKTPRKAGQERQDRRITRSSTKVSSSPHPQGRTSTSKISSPSPHAKQPPRTDSTKKNSHNHQSSKTPDAKGRSPSSPRPSRSSRTPLGGKDTPKSAEKQKRDVRKALDLHSDSLKVEENDSKPSDSPSESVSGTRTNGCTDSDPESSNSKATQVENNDVDLQEDHPKTSVLDVNSVNKGSPSEKNENRALTKHDTPENQEKAIKDDTENDVTRSPSKDEEQSKRGKKRKYPFKDGHYGLKQCKVHLKQLTLGPQMLGRLQSVKFFLIRRNSPTLIPNPKAAAPQPRKDRSILPKPVDPLSLPPVAGFDGKKFTCKRCGYVGKSAGEVTKHFNVRHLGLYLRNRPLDYPSLTTRLPSCNDASGLKTPQASTKTSGLKTPQASAVTSGLKTPQASAVTSGLKTPQASTKTSGLKTPQASAVTSGLKTPQASAETSGLKTPQASAGTSGLKTPQASTKTSGVKVAKTEESSSESVLSISSGSESDDIEDKGVSCGLCGYRTESLSDLRDHSKYHTGADFCCTICGFKSEVEDDFNNHLQSHKDPQDPDTKRKKIKLIEDGASKALPGKIKSEADSTSSENQERLNVEATSIKVENNVDCMSRKSTIGGPEKAMKVLKCSTCSFCTVYEDIMKKHIASPDHLNKLAVINKTRTQDKDDEPKGRRPEDRRFYCEPCDVLLSNHQGYTKHCLRSVRHKSIVGDKEVKPVITYVDPDKGFLRSIKSEASSSAETVRRPVTPTLSSLRGKRNRKPVVLSDSEKEDNSNDDSDHDDDEESDPSDAAVDDSGSDEDYNPAWEEAKERQRSMRRRSARYSFGERDKKPSFSDLLKVVKVEEKTQRVKIGPVVSVHSPVERQVNVTRTVCTPDVIIKSMDAGSVDVHLERLQDTQRLQCDPLVPGFMTLSPDVRLCPTGDTSSRPKSPRKSPVENVASHPVLKQISIITKSEGNKKSFDKTFTCATCGYRTTFLSSFNKHLHWRGHEAMPEPEPERVEAAPKAIKTEPTSASGDSDANSHEGSSPREKSPSKTHSLLPNPKAANHVTHHQETPCEPEPRRPVESPTSTARSSRRESKPESPSIAEPTRSASRTGAEPKSKSSTDSSTSAHGSHRKSSVVDSSVGHSKRKSSDEPKSSSSTHKSPNLSPNPKRPRSTASEESEKKKEARPASRRDERLEDSPVSDSPSSDNSNDMYHLKFMATTVLPKDEEQPSSASADIPIGCLFCDFKSATVSGLATHMKQHVL